MSSLMLAVVAGATAIVYPPAPRGTVYIDFDSTTCATERQKTLEVSIGDGGPVECNLEVGAPVIDLSVAGTTCVKQIHDRIVAKTAAVQQAQCFIGSCCYLPGTLNRFFKFTHDTVSCATVNQAPLATTIYSDSTCTTVDQALSVPPGSDNCQTATINTNVPISMYHYAWGKTGAQICELFTIATKLERAGTAYTTNYYNGAGCTDGDNLVAAGNLLHQYGVTWNQASAFRRDPDANGIIDVTQVSQACSMGPCTGCCVLYDRTTCSYVPGLYEIIERSCNSDTHLVVRRQVFLDEKCDQLHTAFGGYDAKTVFDSKQTCNANEYKLTTVNANLIKTNVLSFNGWWEASQALPPLDTDFCTAARISRGYSDLLVDDDVAEARAQAARDRVLPIPPYYGYHNAATTSTISIVVVALTLMSVLL